MKGTLWRGALWLVVTAIIVKMLGALYRVPYQNWMGDTGYYVYGQIYPFFALAVTFAAYGYPTAVSRRLSFSTDDRFAMFWALILLGVSSFLLLFYGAPVLASLMEDSRLTEPLRAVSFAYLLFPFLAYGRGFLLFYGRLEDVSRTQLLEQSVRVIGIIFSAFIGMIIGAGAYHTAIWAIVASLGGMAIGCMLIAFFLIKEGRSNKRNDGVPTLSAVLGMVRRLVVEGPAFCLSLLFVTVFFLIDAVTVMPLLSAEGAARKAKGIYDRGIPFIQLAATIASAFSAAFIPSRLQSCDQTAASKVVLFSFKGAACFGAAMALGLFLLAGEINVMFFQNRAGTLILRLFALALFFIVTAIIVQHVLHSLGYFRRPLFILGSAIGIKTLANVVLVSQIGLVGAALATCIGFAWMAVAGSVMLFRLYPALFTFSKRTVFGYIGSLLFMGIAVVFFRQAIGELVSVDSRGGASFMAVGGTVVGACVYVFALFKFGVFHYQDWKLFSTNDGRSIIEKTFIQKGRSLWDGRLRLSDSGRETRNN